MDWAHLKSLLSISSLVAAAFWGAIVPAHAQVNVTQYHNHSSRDGLYIDSAFTQSAAANLVRDLNFDGTIAGDVYAQPLYIEGGPNGRAIIIAVTESNNVYALDAIDGSIIWQRNVGDPVSVGDLHCTEFDPMGIIGTPIVNLASRALFFDAMTTPDGGATKKHLIFSLNVDTGGTNPGWPVDVGATASYNGINFIAAIQLQRPALAIVRNILYVPFGSMGDCDLYHGWLVGVPINNPASVTAWAASPFIGGAIWGVGGVASDGNNPFVTTGNTFNTGGNWSGSEAVIRFQSGPIFSGDPRDYWVPTNWLQLDNNDLDLGSSGPLLVDVPGATPSHLVVAMGKDKKAYLVNRDNLGGITDPIDSLQVSDNFIIQAAATYRTDQGTYVAFRGSGSTLSTFRITATNPPTITTGWGVNRSGGGSPFVTSTDGTNDVIVWVVGAGYDLHLHGYDGDTGAVIYAGGDFIAGMHAYSTTGIVARGRIYVAGDNKVYAFKLPGGAPTPTPTPTERAVVADFNGAGHPDFVVRNVTTRQTAIWYLNNNVFAGSAWGPTLAAGWGLRSVGDFNRDTHPDYALFNPVTDQTAIWYLSGPTFIRDAQGPTLPGGWELVAAADFNRDGKPDYALYKPSTRQTAIWYLNNNVFAGSAWGPTLPAGWNLMATADFNRDGKPDYALYKPSTRQTAIWYLNNNVFARSAWGPTLPAGWNLVAAADFNGDGKPDYVLYKGNTRQSAIWYMNNNVFIRGANGPTFPAGWSLVGP